MEKQKKIKPNVKKGKHIGSSMPPVTEIEPDWVREDRKRKLARTSHISKLISEHPERAIEDAIHVHQRPKVDEYEGLLTGNPIWVMRTKGVAKLSAEDAIALSASGPTLRGSGVDVDLRRDMPYSGYENFKFKVPVGKDGDVFTRYMCRVQELRESIAIVQQALDGMPEGPIKANAPKVVLPDREKMKTEMEALIYHFKIITEGFAVPEGEVYQAVESPRGEMGYYIVSDGSAKPYRVHMRAACLANLQALPSMCEGHLIADVVAAIGSIDIVLGEIDR